MCAAIFTVCGLMAISIGLTSCKETKARKDRLASEEMVAPSGLHPETQQEKNPDYVGTYLDEDNHEPNLFISQRTDGSYDVNIGIFRLTSLDDGVGTLGSDGLRFTATDASGNPISGIITINGDTACVTFTASTWALLEPGSTFHYVREQQKDCIK